MFDDPSGHFLSWEDIKNFGNGAWDWTKNAAIDAWDWTKQAALETWDWTKEKYNSAVEWVNEAEDSVAELTYVHQLITYAEQGNKAVACMSVTNRLRNDELTTDEAAEYIASVICMDNDTDYAKQRIKATAKWNTEYILIPSIDITKDLWERTIDGTITYGFSVHAVFGVLSIDGLVGIAMDKDGNIGYVYTNGYLEGYGYGLGTPAASVNIFETVTDAPSIYKLNGPSFQAGGSVDISVVGIGLDYVHFYDSDTGEPYHGNTVSVGIGAPVPVEFHGNVTKSSVVGINIFEHLYGLTDRIMDM